VKNEETLEVWLCKEKSVIRCSTLQNFRPMS